MFWENFSANNPPKGKYQTHSHEMKMKLKWKWIGHGIQSLPYDGISVLA